MCCQLAGNCGALAGWLCDGCGVAGTAERLTPQTRLYTVAYVQHVWNDPGDGVFYRVAFPQLLLKFLPALCRPIQRH